MWSRRVGWGRLLVPVGGRLLGDRRRTTPGIFELSTYIKTLAALTTGSRCENMCIERALRCFQVLVLGPLGASAGYQHEQEQESSRTFEAL